MSVEPTNHYIVRPITIRHGPAQGPPVRPAYQYQESSAPGWSSGALPKDRVPQELRAFDRKRGEELQRLATSLRDRSFIPEPASLISIRKTNHPEERRPITLIRPEDRIVLTALNGCSRRCSNTSSWSIPTLTGPAGARGPPSSV